MARKKGWSGDLSPFGLFLQAHAVERDKIAKAVGVTPSYISLLAHGKAKPGLQTAIAIERWTRDNVQKDGRPVVFECEAWYERAAA